VAAETVGRNELLERAGARLIEAAGIMAGKFAPAHTPGTGTTWFRLQAVQTKDLGPWVVAAGESRHDVRVDQPEVVATAIEDVVATARPEQVGHAGGDPAGVPTWTSYSSLRVVDFGSPISTR
jgi:hypothetical protein